MAIKILNSVHEKLVGNKNHIRAEIIVDSVSELPTEINNNVLTTGSIAWVVSTGEFYALDPNSTWHKQSGEGGGFTPTTEQLEAMNSGITTEGVEQIATNKNNILLKADATDLRALEAEVNAKADSSDLTTVTADYFNTKDYIVQNYRIPSFITADGYVKHSDGTIVSDNNYYKRTSSILLKSGETIRCYGAGSASVDLLSEWENGVRVQTLIQGNGKYRHYEYTADHDMYIVAVGQVKYVDNQQAILTLNDFQNIIIYNKTQYYKKVYDSPLYGKTITLMGDSLAAGSISGNDAVWLHELALKYNMTEYNLGVNGNAITAGAGTGTPMCERYAEILESDYIIIEGGANDKNSDAPIGTESDTTTETFAGSIYTIINGIRSMYPHAKLVFLTDYNRYASRYRGYADMMIKVCARYSVPCFDNFGNIGIDLITTGTKEWQDEGYVLTGTANLHISPAAYREVLLPRYEAFLTQL